MKVEALVSELAVEALDEGVLNGLAGFDEPQRTPVFSDQSTSEDVAAGKPAKVRPAKKKHAAKARPGKARDVPPALATLKPKAPHGTRWVHEIKFDGYRLQAQIRGGKAKLLTRSGQDWSGRFGKSLTDALAALPCKTAILDGELVVEGAGGASDTSALQADLSARRTSVANAPARVAKTPDPRADFLASATPLPGAPSRRKTR